jgi:hypothetical protein
MLLLKISSLWGCYKPGHVTNRDVLLLATLWYVKTNLPGLGETRSLKEPYVMRARNQRKQMPKIKMCQISSGQNSILTAELVR